MSDTLTPRVFHYAPGAYFEEIISSGELRPSNTGGSPNEPAAVWFSLRETFEPTALKPRLRPDGTVRMMSFAQLAAEYGAVRFILPATDQRLLPWSEACRAIGIDRDERREMERKGRKLGGDPAHWFAILSAVPMDDLSVEMWHLGEWVRVVEGEEDAPTQNALV